MLFMECASLGAEDIYGALHVKHQSAFDFRYMFNLTHWNYASCVFHDFFFVFFKCYVSYEFAA